MLDIPIAYLSLRTNVWTTVDELSKNAQSFIQ